MQATSLHECLADGSVDLPATLVGLRVWIWFVGPSQPLVEPRQRHPQQDADNRVRHPIEGPLVGDETCHAHFVASFTHRTTDRLRTSRSIRSSAFSTRSRFSSSMSTTDRPLVPSCSARSLANQLPSVPSLIPRSRAT